MSMKKLRITLAALGLAALFSIPATTAAIAAPAAPTDLRQEISTESGIKMIWSKVTGATNYEVSIYTADGKTALVKSASTNGANEYILNDVEKKILKPGTSYAIHVVSVDSSGKSDPAKAAAATAPVVMTTFEQTAATSNTITLAWTESPGATAYLIKMGADAASAKDLTTVTKGPIKLSNLKADTAYYVAVYPIRKVTDTFLASEKCCYINKAITTAGAVSGLELAEWDVRTNYIRLAWENTAKYESGYQIELYKSNNKVYKTYNVRGRNLASVGYTLKKLKNKPFYFKVRTYNTFNDVKSYGEWSKPCYCIPEANVTVKKASNTAVTLSWDKVEGAKQYLVYRTTTDGGKYSKIATVKTLNFTNDNLTEGQDYYYFVKADKVKIGGKKRKSTAIDIKNDVYVTLYTAKREAENK